VREAARRILGERSFREAARRCSEDIAQMPSPDEVVDGLEKRFA
jgi:UDP:flavonoid glycosyltransferase YjiC (YdhE family)